MTSVFVLQIELLSPLGFPGLLSLLMCPFPSTDADGVNDGDSTSSGKAWIAIMLPKTLRVGKQKL